MLITTCIQSTRQTFVLRTKRAHLEGLCCLQCISHETIEQNIHKGIDFNKNGRTRKQMTGITEKIKHNINYCKLVKIGLTWREDIPPFKHFVGIFENNSHTMKRYRIFFH